MPIAAAGRDLLVWRLTGIADNQGNMVRFALFVSGLKIFVSGYRCFYPNSRRIQLLVWFSVILSAGVTQIRPSDTHMENIRFGQSALGMGGSVTGFIAEPEASYYNPAGLGFMRRGWQLSGTFQWYSIDSRSLKNGLNLESEIGQAEDLNYTSFFVLPSSSVITRSAGRNATFAFSTFLIPNDEVFEAVLESRSSAGGSSELYSFYTNRTVRDNQFWLGPSFAYRISQFSLGISAFLVSRSTQSNYRVGRNRRPPNSNTGNVVYSDYSHLANINDGTVLGRAGIMWRPNKLRSMGVMFSSHSERIFGGGSLSSFSIVSNDPSDASVTQAYQGLLRQGLTAYTRYPMFLQIGYAEKFRFYDWSISGGYYFASKYHRLSISDRIVEENTVGFVNKVQRKPTINLATGLAYKGVYRWPIRMGVFTNLSSAPDIPDVTDIAHLPDIDHIGLSLSMGYRTRRQAINLGAEVMYGFGHDQIYTGTGLERRYERIERQRLQVVIFLFGAIEFAKETTEDLVDDISK